MGTNSTGLGFASSSWASSSTVPVSYTHLIKKGVDKGVVHTADSIEELAEAAGLPVYPVMKTIERYNQLCDAGEDADFHKKPEDLQKIEQGPFYAIEITPNTNEMCIRDSAMIVRVESLDDPRLDAYARLTEVQLRSKLEPAQGIFCLLYTSDPHRVVHRPLHYEVQAERGVPHLLHLLCGHRRGVRHRPHVRHGSVRPRGVLVRIRLLAGVAGGGDAALPAPRGT